MENMENMELEPQPGERILKKLSEFEEKRKDYIASHKEKYSESKMRENDERGKEARELFESFDLSWLSEAQENFILRRLDDYKEFNDMPLREIDIEKILILLETMKTLNKS